MLSISQDKKIILDWLLRIEHSSLSIKQFFVTHDVPFGDRQYYRFRAKYHTEGLNDNRSQGGNRKITQRAEDFLRGIVTENPEVKLERLQQLLKYELNCEITKSGIKRALVRIIPDHTFLKGRPKLNKKRYEIKSLGGFDLIVAIAYYLKWPQKVERCINQAIKNLKRSKIYKSNRDSYDTKCRNKKGNFSKSYNKRKDVRTNRFSSVYEKRLNKNFTSMSIVKDGRKTMIRKNLAMLSLPVITLNGNVRTVDTALGESLKHICGFNYKQKTLTKFLGELKYIGIATNLLQELTKFWKETWSKDSEKSIMGSLLCYYIDGNTKALWSSNRVKKNKVTMIGRVMGCLEQVFIHDGFGHPIYFETYSGHGPIGEHILGMFEKIEDVILEVPHSRTKVNRVIVMDGGHNSVRTLRAFAEQKIYHYITPLDDNQWNERRVIKKRGRPSRYKYGDATLTEVDIELSDSTESKYLVISRGVRIDWDNGKVTVLLTNLPRHIVDSSQIVHSYFKRWPCQETQYKIGKSVVSIHRVVGYGKREVDDEKVLENQKRAEDKIKELQKILAEPLDQISIYEEKLTNLITKEVRIKSKCKIKNGGRVIPEDLQEKFTQYNKEISKYQRLIKKIEKEQAKDFKPLKKHQKNWFNLQGKEKVYEVDVELDQIVTFYRISLANFYAYFIKNFLEEDSISMVMLLHRIIHLQGSITENDNERHTALQYNEKDPMMMEKLQKVIIKVNRLNIRGLQNKLMTFSLEAKSKIK